MLKPLLERLAAGDLLLADGAMGTLLMQHGLSVGDCPEQWNLDRTEVLSEIARRYGEAGADIVQANTFGASPLNLSHYGLEALTDEINARAVRAVRDAVGDRTCVAASCGPCGRVLEPYGDVPLELVSDGFRRQLAAVAAVGVDLICVETMTDLTEASLAVKAAKAVAPSVPVSATMTFDATPRGFRTIMGVSIEEAVAGLTDAGADILGANCGYGIESLTAVALEFRKLTDMPLLIQPNAGLPVVEADGPVYPETPEFMAAGCRKLFAAGVNMVGGCCGTTPEHTAAMRRALDGILATRG